VMYCDTQNVSGETLWMHALSHQGCTIQEVYYSSYVYKAKQFLRAFESFGRRSPMPPKRRTLDALYRINLTGLMGEMDQMMCLPGSYADD
jgi:hypothetical protein